MSGIIQKFQFGEHTVTLETGIIARQATGTVIVDVEGTTVMVAAVGKPSDPSESRGFFPLTVNYQERAYAAGKVPGGFFKREGRPSERETLVCRLIDRPIRPLFPKGFEGDVQVTATVVSLNPEISPDIPAIIGASAALAITGMPFNGPVGAARVGYINGQYILNPSPALVKESQLDLVVAGTEQAVLMVESEAKELSEDVMLGAVMYGHEQMQVAIDAIKALVAEAGKPAWDWQPPAENTELKEKVSEQFAASINTAYQVSDKLERQNQLEALRAQAEEALVTEAENSPTAPEVAKIFSSLEKHTVRSRILNAEPRIDGRDNKTVRPIKIDVGVFPRTHGSALFTRGETQALVITTLGTEKDAQTIDSLEGEYKDTFMLHYNFPPYCVGETGMSTGPKRREIGHGKLAKRALQAVVPTMQEFPYVTRVVSEITESNGSSSMASVCGGSLSMMDAGVPLKAPVAGIAMGLIKDGEQYAVLTDILGDEDHLGDMDFKVAGTHDGVTALQMDIKIDGITKDIMEQALAQAKDGRMHILGIMAQTIETSRNTVSEYAPSILQIKVHPDKIRDVIGKGGATIRSLTEETGSSIDINDDGVIKIASSNREAGREVMKRIEMIVADAEVGRVYDGKVVKIVEFGAFVNFLPGKDGLVHISQISEERVENVADVLQEGQEVKVKVLEIDKQGRIRLSMKEAETAEGESESETA